MAQVQGEEIYLSHSGQEVDDNIEEVVAARGSSSTLSAGIAAAVAAETALREAADAALQTAIDAKASISDVFGLGTAIASGDNLDNYKTLGVFYCSTAGIAASLFNCPSSYTFRLEVKTTNGSARFLQTIYEAVPSGSLAGQIAVYRRAFTASGWGSWYKFEGTVVQPINVPASASLQALGRPDITIDDPGEEEQR